MNNLEKEIQDKTAEEIYDFLWFLFHDMLERIKRGDSDD